MNSDEWESLKKELIMIADGHPDIRIRFAPKLFHTAESPFLLAVVVLKEKRPSDRQDQRANEENYPHYDCITERKR